MNKQKATTELEIVSSRLEDLKINEASDPNIAFVVTLGSALQVYGIPSHHLEEVLNRIVEKLGMEGQIFALPTRLLLSIGPKEAQRTTLIRNDLGEIDLGKLTELDDVAERVIQGKLQPQEGVLEIEEILAAEPRYPTWLFVLSYAVVSAAVCSFLRGTWRESAAAGGIGLFVGLMSALWSRSANASLLLTPTASAFTAACAVLVEHLIFPISVYRTTLAGLVALLPGYTFTTAITELATRNLIAGAGRLVWAIIIFLMIGSGVALGSQVERFFAHSVSAPFPVGRFGISLLLALLFSPIAFAIRFNAHPKDIGWIVLVSIFSSLLARPGATLAGTPFGSFLGAFIACASSKVFARRTGRPSAVVLVPAILLLVPGSIGYGSVSNFLEGNVVDALSATFQTIFLAISLVLGILFANALVNSPKAL